MTVCEAEKIIEQIDDTINQMNKITKLDHETDIVENMLAEAKVGMIWKNIALYSVNSMAAYKNILKEKIKNANLE